MAAWKVLPAIAAGNTIVLKPAEITPLTSVLFAEAVTEAGRPPGVVNVVTGTGPVAGQRLVGTPTSRWSRSPARPAWGAGHGDRRRHRKRVHLELGGKAPFVVFDDADLEAAVHGAVAASLINTGQDCTAATRAIVHRSLHDDFVAGVADLMASVRSARPPTRPPTSARCRCRHQGQGRRDGRPRARLRQGRHRAAAPGGDLAPGATTSRPSSRTCRSTPRSWRDEVFGPVLAVVPFDDDDEAIRLANDTPFGLAASAWTRDAYRARRATREIAAGCVWVNDHIPIISEMPHGGYRHSGFGKDMSAYSFDEYTNVKHVMHDTTAVARKPWHRTIFTLPG